METLIYSSLKTKKKTTHISSTFALAQQLGLSEWTVSRAINGHPEVKAATRERILKAMDEHNFRPNPVARGLRGKSMGIVGVSFGMARNVLMMEKIAILDEFLRGHNLLGVLAICPPDEASQIQIVKNFKSLRVDGIVLVQSYIRPSELLKVMEGVRCVHVDNFGPELSPRIWLDRPQAQKLILDHLWDLGHRSFATIGYSSKDIWRWQGVVEWAESRGLRLEDCTQSFVLPAIRLESYGEGSELAEMVVRTPRRPTAILAINDEVAAGAVKRLVELGYKVPGDISVVGFGNFAVGRFFSPALTTIDQQPQPMMRMAGEMLISQLGGKKLTEEVENIRLEPELLVRDSTGPAPRV